MNYVVTYKGRRVRIFTAESKWHAIDMAYSEAIASGFDAKRIDFDAFPTHRAKKTIHKPTPPPRSNQTQQLQTVVLKLFPDP